MYLGAFGFSGPWEWVVILVIVVIFFGVGKLPNVLGQMGKGGASFKKGMKDTDKDDAPPEIEVMATSDSETTKVTEAEEIRPS